MPGTRVSYFILFAVLTVVGTGLHAWHAVATRSDDETIEVVLDIISGISTIGIAAATIAITITEGARYTMVIAQWFEDTYIKPAREKRNKRLRAEMRAEGRAEARAELISEIQVWEQRRVDAEERGEVFTEPPPYAEESEQVRL